MPIDDKTGGKVSYIQNKDAMCLTENQVSYVYKKVELGNIINTETMMHEIEQEKIAELDREDDNPYKKLILNKVYNEEDKMIQMETGQFLATMLDMYSMTEIKNLTCKTSNLFTTTNIKSCTVN